MKKILVILISIAMMVSMMAGCTQESTEAPPADNPADNATDNTDDSSNNNSSDNSDEGKLDLISFEDILEVKGLSEAIYYLDDNFDNFKVTAKEEYMDKLLKEVYKRAEMYTALWEIPRSEDPIPPLIEYISGIYDNIYDGDTNTFNVRLLEGKTGEAARAVMEDDTFTLCKSYYCMDGNIEDFGFEAIVKKEISDIMRNRFETEEKENPYLKNMLTYASHLSAMDSTVDSDTIGDTVLVESAGKLELLRNEWKLIAYLPVIMVDEEIAEDQERPEQGEDNQNSDTSSNIEDEDIPVNKAMLNYTGKSLDSLDVKNVDIGMTGGEKGTETYGNDSIAFYGKVYDVEVGYARMGTEDDGTTVEKFDVLEDTQIIIENTVSKDDNYSYAAYVRYYDEDLNYHTEYFAGSMVLSQFNQLNEIDLSNTEASKVNFMSTEHAIVDVMNGNDEDFSAFILVNEFDEYMDEDENPLYLYMDEETYNLNYMEEDDMTSCFPIWVSSDMYDIVIKKGNYGDFYPETYTPVDNIKAGSWLRLYGRFEGDSTEYSIEFTLENGLKKKIMIINDESDNYNAVPGFHIVISEN